MSEQFDPQLQLSAADIQWLLLQNGFTLRELVTGVNPMALSPEEVPSYARLLAVALAEPPEIEEEEEEPEPLPGSDEPSAQPAGPASLDKVELEPTAGPRPYSGPSIPTGLKGDLARMVHDFPERFTSFYTVKMQKAGNQVRSNHTSSSLNSLRKQGWVNSKRSSDKRKLYAWFPTKQLQRAVAEERKMAQT